MSSVSSPYQVKYIKNKPEVVQRRAAKLISDLKRNVVQIKVMKNTMTDSSLQVTRRTYDGGL